jgi:hypothetical protein
MLNRAVHLTLSGYFFVYIPLRFSYYNRKNSAANPIDIHGMFRAEVAQNDLNFFY